MSRMSRFWAEQLVPASLLARVDPAEPDTVGPRSGRDWVVDVVGFVVAVAFGVLILISPRHDSVNRLTTPQLVIDAVCGALACLSLWWRRRWPLGVALACVLLGTFSASATVAGLLALSSLAVHRTVRSVLLVAALWVPSALVYAIYSRRTDAPSVVLLAAALVLAATAWGMFVRARRQLLLTLRERALRAEADQRLHADRARMAERTRIAREMHDVLAHRISLMALHAGGPAVPTSGHCPLLVIDVVTRRNCRQRAADDGSPTSPPLLVELCLDRADLSSSRPPARSSATERLDS